MAQHTFPLRGEFIELHVLLKLLALAPSGGAAKALVAEGAVMVDGRIETRKACKLRAGQRICLGDEEVWLVTADTPPTTTQAEPLDE